MGLWERALAVEAMAGQLRALGWDIEGQLAVYRLLLVEPANDR